jgi:tetratricopeptide (TPR) repeat protein
MKRAQLFFLTFLLLLFCSGAPAEDYLDEDKYFSYERFFLDREVIDNIPGDSRAQRDLQNFAFNFNEGLYAISSGDLEKAEKSLLEARRIWPEYFGTDFLLGRVYEDEGDYKRAARYYKSYLNKLKKFHAGEYRISEPLIRYFASGSIELYEPAREVIGRRLRQRGISLEKVRPAIALPEFILPLILIAVLGIIYTAVVYGFWPYVKKMRRVNNPPEGFWVCRACGTANTNLSKVCEKCGRKHE